MKDTKDQILRSLDGLDRGQMHQVLSYIKNLNVRRSETSRYAVFKNNALRQIREALRIDKNPTASV